MKFFIMRYIFLIVFVSLFSFNINGQIERRVLEGVADKYLITLNPEASSIDKDIKTILDEDTVLAYVVEVNPIGFMVFSANKYLYPLIAYSFDSDFVFEESPYNTLLNLIRDDMRHQLSLIKTTNDERLLELYERNKSKWNGGKTIKNRAFVKLYGPHLPDIWGQVNCKDQDSSYINVTNFYTPNHYAGGCVALSFSQILHYYRWPVHGIGSHTNNDNSGSSQGSYYANFEKTYYDWSNMLNEYMYKVSDTIERKAVGRLVFQAGTALDMDYEYNGSTSNINRTPAALDDYFRYTGHYQTKNWSHFWDRFDENIENGHPLQLDIGGAGAIGHAPVCDGYGVLDNDPDINNRYYHLNMNWWGASNAWYRLRGTFNAGGYTSVDAAVFDILPDPEFEEMQVQNSNIFTLHWNIAANLVCDSFQIQKYINSTWTTIGKTVVQEYADTVDQCGEYRYRVRAKIDGHWYADNYSVPITVFVEGDITSLDFDGNDSYFVNDSIDLLDVNGSDWTIESWVYPTTVPASGTFPAIISRKYSFELYFRNTSGNLGVGMIALDGTGNGFDIEGSFNSGSDYLSLNQWHHIAVSHTGTSTKMYFDGQEVSSSTDPDFDLDASIAAINFGARYSSSSGGYVRYIDDCRLDEIRYSKVARYTVNFTPHHYDELVEDSDDILLMHLDKGTGFDIEDASGNFHGIELRKSPNSPNWSCDANYRGFYVASNGDDNNDGTELSPWKTIGKVNSSSFEPGDHIYFKRGDSWEEFFDFDETKKGSNKANIVIEAYGTGDKPVISHSDYGAIFNGSSFLTIKNFNVKSDLAVLVKGDTDNNPPESIRVLNNDIIDNNNNGTSSAGIYITDGAFNCIVKNNEISNHQTGIWTGEGDGGYSLGCNNLFTDNAIHGNEEIGIEFDKTDCSAGNETKVINNTIYNNGSHGIQMACRYYIIEKNIVYNNGQNNVGGASGIHVFSRTESENQSADRGGDHNIIRYNEVYGTKDDTGARTDGNGVQIDMWCDSNLICNNVIYENDGSGIKLIGSSGNEVYNNTLYGNGQDLGSRAGRFEISVFDAELPGGGILHSQNNLIKNNIGMAVGGEAKRYACTIDEISTNDNNLYSHNLWYNNSNIQHLAIINSNVLTEKTISQWNAYAWTDSEIALNPLFTDALNHDFTLVHSSPAIDIGIDLSTNGILDDFNKKRRPLLEHYDLGAYEHGLYWIGKFNSSWGNKKNWFGELMPNIESCVTIFPDYDFRPIIFNNQSVRKMVLKDTAKLEIMQNNKLDIEP